jgi:hypothetical protein
MDDYVLIFVVVRSGCVFSNRSDVPEISFESFSRARRWNGCLGGESMSSRIVIEIPSSERWTEMKGYLRQWNLKLPPKFVVKDTNRREVRDTIERAQRIVLTHECSEEFTEMLNGIAMDLPKGRISLRAPVKTAGRTQRTRPERKTATTKRAARSHAPVCSKQR